MTNQVSGSVVFAVPIHVSRKGRVKFVCWCDGERYYLDSKAKAGEPCIMLHQKFGKHCLPFFAEQTMTVDQANALFNLFDAGLKAMSGKSTLPEPSRN